MAGGAVHTGSPAGRPRGIRTKSAWLLALPFLVLARPTAQAIWTGALLAVAGLLLRGWAAGTIRKDESLTTTGPYAHLRHPLYVGSLLVGIGLGIAGGHWLWPALVAFFFAAVYRRTLADERERLRGLFGERYLTYAARVPAVVPRLRPYRRAADPAAAADGGDVAGAPAGGFTWARYLRNREWEALLGVAAALALLAAKALLLA
ncbi:MAG TPA: isoprenylcysteine carboxylmethyltransferase family protein [Longimicrobiales bacterium]|nr:isoprenylcysteine carboxylmethyltransferase family protein [Longimicrobiales bacterium]